MIGARRPDRPFIQLVLLGHVLLEIAGVRPCWSNRLRFTWIQYRSRTVHSLLATTWRRLVLTSLISRLAIGMLLNLTVQVVDAFWMRRAFWVNTLIHHIWLFIFFVLPALVSLAVRLSAFLLITLGRSVDQVKHLETFIFLKVICLTKLVDCHSDFAEPIDRHCSCLFWWLLIIFLENKLLVSTVLNFLHPDIVDEAYKSLMLCLILF